MNSMSFYDNKKFVFTFLLLFITTVYIIFHLLFYVYHNILCLINVSNFKSYLQKEMYLTIQLGMLNENMIFSSF